MSNTDPTKTSEGHKTKDEDKQIKEHNTTHESKMMSNTDPTKTSEGHKTKDEDKQTKEHNTLCCVVFFDLFVLVLCLVSL
jgi:hypothetical protein